MTDLPSWLESGVSHQEGMVVFESGQLLLNRYQLQQQLGNTPWRQTWLAFDQKAKPSCGAVIVKLLAFTPQIQWYDIKLFEREAQILKNLNHPRIPQYRDAFSLDKQTGAGLYWLGLVHHYIAGSSLQWLLNQGQHFTQQEVRSFATQLLEILIYLHELSPPVLHRDLKPSNMILADDGQVHLVDFGAVQDCAAAEGVTFTVVGSSGYAPLEQFWGRAVPASDLYALGATLIHLLTGTSPADLPQHQMRIQFTEHLSLNPHLVKWIEKLTNPDVEERFPTARQALETLNSSSVSSQEALAKIPQPPGSSVELSSSPQQLIINLPRTRRSLPDYLALSTRGLLLTALNLVLTLIFGVGLIWGFREVNLVILIFALSGLAVVGKGAQKLILSGFIALGPNRLRFRKDSFTLEWRFFKYCYYRQKGHPTDIQDVFQKAISTTPNTLDPLKNGSKQDMVAIQTHKEQYSFGVGLSNLECRWLVNEIKAWLSRQ